MRKAISLVIAAVMLSSSVIPAFAQKRLANKSLAGKQAPPVAKKPSSNAESTRFANFTAYTDGTGVWLHWQMGAEVGNVGFNAYRVGKGGAELLDPTNGIIPGAATHGREVPSYGESYSFFDGDGTGDSAYYIEALSLSGEKATTVQVYPQYVSELRSVTGLSREELERRGESTKNRIESNLLALDKELANEVSANTLAPDPVTHRSVISQPGVVRIGVKGEGLYRVTRAQLQAAGFNTATDSTLWQLYIEGVEQAIIVGPNADYIEFYGKGTDTPETDMRKYFLVNGAGPGKRIQTRVATRNTSTVVWPSYAQVSVRKQRTRWVDDIINGDAENYFGSAFNTATIPTFTFNITGIDTNFPTARLRLKIQGYSSTDHAVEVTLNNQLLGTQPAGSGAFPFWIEFTVPTSLLLEGANSIKFKAVGAPTDFCFFDTLTLDFSRKYLAEQNRLSFFTQNYRGAQLTGFSSANVRVFDMTNESEPTLLTNLTFQQNGPTFGTNMPAARGRVFYAIEDSGLLAPESVTPNDPELVGIPTNGADLVIISYKDLLPQAQIWANYRIAQGISVKVIEVTELFDEFNYGTFSSNAIKSFLQYANTSWANPPEYALLMGDASWDSRNYENLGNFNFVPPKMVSTVWNDLPSDEALADFNGDGLAEIAIGRIPARTATEATTAYNKMVQWESLPPAQWNTRGAVFAYDHDVGYPFAQMSATLRNQIPMVPATMVYRGDVNANANLVNALGTGPFIANYSGHGTAGSWGGNPTFFNVFSVPTIADSNPSIYTMLTCLNGYFHWLYNPSMAEVLLFTPNKGAVIAWASTGRTTADVQEVMAIRFYQKLGEGTIPRVGDLIKDAKTALDGGSDVRLSWALLGDPMTKVR